MRANVEESRRNTNDGYGHPANGEDRHQALGAVVRDAIDHTAMILRDTAKLGRLEVRDFQNRVLAPGLRKAGIGVTIALFASLAAVFGLLAIFLGIAAAIDSVAWTFAIFAGAFAVVAMLVGPLAGREKKPEHIAESKLGEEKRRAAALIETREIDPVRDDVLP